MQTDKAKISQIWSQKQIPVIARPPEPRSKLRVRLPYLEYNYEWLSGIGKTKPKWNNDRKRWDIPKSWFDDLVDACLNRFGMIYVIQPYREMEKCSPACQNAKGHECQCSCMGANHGNGNDGSWFEVLETFACRWEERQIACRLMTKKRQPIVCLEL